MEFDKNYNGGMVVRDRALKTAYNMEVLKRTPENKEFEDPAMPHDQNMVWWKDDSEYDLELVGGEDY